MNFKTVLILFLTIIFSHDLEAHEFYLSYTSVKHNPENEELFIRIKLFVNDLEESLFEYQSLDFQKNSPIENKENYIEKKKKATLVEFDIAVDLICMQLVAPKSWSGF